MSDENNEIRPTKIASVGEVIYLNKIKSHSKLLERLEVCSESLITELESIGWLRSKGFYCVSQKEWKRTFYDKIIPLDMILQELKKSKAEL